LWRPGDSSCKTAARAYQHLRSHRRPARASSTLAQRRVTRPRSSRAWSVAPAPSLPLSATPAVRRRFVRWWPRQARRASSACARPTSHLRTPPGMAAASTPHTQRQWLCATRAALALAAPVGTTTSTRGAATMRMAMAARLCNTGSACVPLRHRRWRTLTQTRTLTLTLTLTPILGARACSHGIAGGNRAHGDAPAACACRRLLDVLGAP